MHRPSGLPFIEQSTCIITSIIQFSVVILGADEDMLYLSKKMTQIHF